MTQKKLARILNISRSSVSLALIDSPKVKEETKERVKRLAASLNYRPNNAARSLYFKRTFSVGIVLPPSYKEPFYADLEGWIHYFLHRQNYAGVFHTAVGAHEEKEAINFLLNRGVDGIILYSQIDEESMLSLKKENIKVVFYGEPSMPNDYVSIDFHKGARLATEHFIRCGHKKIGFIGLEDTLEPRFTGYKDALLRNNLILNDKWVISLVRNKPKDFEQGYKCMRRMLSLRDKPTAVFARNDVFAIGAMHAIEKQDLRIPGDVAVVGFDDIEGVRFLNPPLSTISVPRKEIARELTRILLNRIEGGCSEAACEKVIIQPKLIIRESCGSKEMSSRKNR